jgi:hypothetical protein
MKSCTKRKSEPKAAVLLCGIEDNKNGRSRGRLQLPLLGSNQDSSDPESDVLPVTPRGKKVPRIYVEAVISN